MTVVLTTAVAIWVLGRRATVDSAERIAFPDPRAGVDDSVSIADFAGADACASCHKTQYDAWRGSTHGRAGAVPAVATLLRDVDGSPIRFRDATVTPRRDGVGLAFLVDWQDTIRVLEVEGVIGGGHLAGGGTQGFVSRHADGSLRLLPFELERRGGQWFCSTNTRLNRGWKLITSEMSLTDCGDWPPARVLGTAPRFASCQECHASQVQLSASGQVPYQTTVQSYAIDCESCHGPARRHIALAAAGSERTGLTPLSTLDVEESLEVCFRCHALKDNVRPGFIPGKKLADYYSLSLSLLGSKDVHADGRTRTFAYQQGHLYSDCYLSGRVSCNDCHEPHGQNFRDVSGRRLASRFDDAQCTACHASKAEHPERHTHHRPVSDGSRCVSCHMPYLQQPEVGSEIQYARSDHTIGIPRPAADSSQGIAYACAGCHRDRGARVLQQFVDDWWGELKPRPLTVQRLLELPETAAEKSLRAVILEDDGAVPTALYDALGRWLITVREPGQQRLDRGFRKRLESIADGEDPELVSLALAALHMADGESAASRRFLGTRLAALGQRDAQVRGRWAIVLGFLGDRFLERGDGGRAAMTYRRALEINPSAPLWVSYGSALLNAGSVAEASGAFRAATLVEPRNPLSWINLGMVATHLGDTDAARRSYEQAIALNPFEPIAHFNLANTFARANNLSAAVRAYEQAIRLDPGFAEAWFNLARMHLARSEWALAQRALLTGLAFDRDNADGLQMSQELAARQGR